MNPLNNVLSPGKSVLTETFWTYRPQTLTEDYYIQLRLFCRTPSQAAPQNQNKNRKNIWLDSEPIWAHGRHFLQASIMQCILSNLFISKEGFAPNLRIIIFIYNQLGRQLQGPMAHGASNDLFRLTTNHLAQLRRRSASLFDVSFARYGTVRSKSYPFFQQHLAVHSRFIRRECMYDTSACSHISGL